MPRYVREEPLQQFFEGFVGFCPYPISTSMSNGSQTFPDIHYRLYLFQNLIIPYTSMGLFVIGDHA